MPRMEIARALSFDVPSSSIIPTEADEDIEIKEHLVDPYAKIEQEVEPFNQSFEPFVGMEFDSIDLGYKFYNFYGFKTGFGIRKAQNYHSNTGEKKVISQRYVCSKEGLSKRQKHESVEVGKSANVKTPEKAISFVRTGCKTSMSISLQPNGRWLVTTFNKEHNHDLVPSPSKKKYFKSHMHIREDQKECICILHNQNVPPTKIFVAIVEKEGGRQNILFSKKLLNNEIAKENRKLVGVDVKKALEYFRKMQETDPDFFFEVEPDDNQTTKNIFWIDGRAEGADSFKWLFRTFLKAMNGKHPKAIITDQDPAMKVAIGEVFPNTKHRCCQWHVMRKARDKLGVLYDQKKGFEQDLQACINLSLTIEEFENQWKDMLKNHNLQGNNHLDLMFRTRDRWVPAYFRGTFFADMSTSQRSESANAILKLWTDSHTSIFKFVTQYNKMVEGNFTKEDEEDFRSCTQQPQQWSYDPIETEARRVYTRKIYSLFKNIFRRSTGYTMDEIEKDVIYEVKRIPDPTNPDWKTMAFQVCVNKASNEVSRNCQGFEFEGLLCSHSLKVMQNLGIHLDSRYVLLRWTKEANQGVKRYSDDARSVEVLRSDADRYDCLRMKAMKIVEKFCKPFEVYNIASTKLDVCYNEIDELTKNI